MGFCSVIMNFYTFWLHSYTPYYCSTVCTIYFKLLFNIKTCLSVCINNIVIVDLPKGIYRKIRRLLCEKTSTKTVYQVSWEARKSRSYIKLPESWRRGLRSRDTAFSSSLLLVLNCWVFLIGHFRHGCLNQTENKAHLPFSWCLLRYYHNNH